MQVLFPVHNLMGCNMLRVCTSHVTCNSQHTEATQVPINRQMSKNAVVHVYNGVLRDYKKE